MAEILGRAFFVAGLLAVLASAGRAGPAGGCLDSRQEQDCEVRPNRGYECVYRRVDCRKAEHQERVEAPVFVSTLPFFGRMRMQYPEPEALIRLSVAVPHGMELRYAERSLPRDVNFHREADARLTRYVWEARSQPALKKGKQAPTITFALADIWPNVAASLAALLRARSAPEPELAVLVARLSEGKPKAAQRLEALYDFVAKDIASVPVSMEDSGFVPRSAAEILKSKAGNDLDKPFLLFAMLQEAGWRPELVYMETRGRDPLEASLPNLRQFSAAAVRVVLNGRKVFLAPVGEARRCGQMPGKLRGVRGLVAFPEESAGALITAPSRDAVL